MKIEYENNKLKLQYKILKNIQDKLKNDKEFAEQYYNDIMENVFKFSKLAAIEDIKLGDSYPYKKLR